MQFFVNFIINQYKDTLSIKKTQHIGVVLLVAIFQQHFS